ncbi:MAG: hypothetical protein CMI10_01340 [Oceanospirillaceae bacterium]|nr:hypothetical protein [Oceanospirillaceae bacterium]|tara:strand:+ start:1076 stop:3625 length:2550 start_codon:yes stop_codon:yes gene_type:complete
MPESSSKDNEVKASAALGTNVEKLYWWISENPVEGLTPKESQVSLVSLLWMIHAPHDLRQFLGITELLPDVIENLTKIAPEGMLQRLRRSGVCADSMQLTALHLHENEENLIDVLGTIIEPKSSGARHPMVRNLGKFYVYSALMSLSESNSPKVDELLNSLKSAVLLCHAQLLISNFPPQKYLLVPSESAYQSKEAGREKSIFACRFIRQASYDLEKAYTDDIGAFETINELYKSLESKKDLDVEAYKKLAPLLRHTLNGYEGSGSGGGRRGGRGRWTFNGWFDGFVRGRDGLFQERFEDDGSDTLIINTPDSEDEEEQEAGLAPEEKALEDELILVTDDNPKARRILAKHQVKHLEMANQHLPFDWSRNTTAELSEVLKLLGKLIRQSTNDLVLETVCITMIMLATGETLERVATLFRFYWLGNKISRKAIAYCWNPDSQGGLWKIHPILPSQQVRLSPAQRAYCEQPVRDRGIELPDALKIGQFIFKAFPEEVLQNKVGRKIFTRKVSTYRSSLNQILSLLPEGNRINEHRIRSHLFNAIVSQISGDVAEATLMSGRYHPMAKTRLHYSSYPVHYLQDLYISALEAMVNDVYREGYDHPERHLPRNAQIQLEVIGSDYSPRKSAVQQAVSTLITSLKKRPSKDSLSEMTEFHNRYTLYTVLMTGFCTGYRAVKDPFPSVPDIDRETGLCVISDKDGPDFYNSRLVWLPPMLIFQLDHYEEHRNVLISMLVMNNDNIELLSTLPDLFLLDDKLNIVPIRPSTLKPLLEDLLPLPINTNRRYLRTHLRLRGCPTEIVDAFMGHWARGEEPWGKYSSLSYAQVIEELKHYLEPLVSELGFRPIRSRMYGF